MRQRSILRRCALLVLFVFITVVYLGIYAIIMRTVERPVEDRNFDDQYDEVLKINLSDAIVEELEDLGMCTFPSHRHRHWTVSGSAFFALTVITTIGYGGFAPETHKGRVITVFFGIVGIGVIGQMLAQCAALLQGVVKEASFRFQDRKSARRRRQAFVDPAQGAAQWARACERFFPSSSGVGGDLPSLPGSELATFLAEVTGCHEPDLDIVEHVLRQVDVEDTGTIPLMELPRAVQLWNEVQMELPHGVTLVGGGLSVGLAAVWVLVWGAVFSMIEGWSYRESMWFCFVTMSTIGFGDFIPETHLGRAMAFLFIIPGLGLGASALGVLWEAFTTWRFWWLQRAHRRGTISAKLLEAHGIGVIIRGGGSRRSHSPRAQTARGGGAAEGGLINFTATRDNWQRDDRHYEDDPGEHDRHHHGRKHKRKRHDAFQHLPPLSRKTTGRRLLRSGLSSMRGLRIGSPVSPKARSVSDWSREDLEEGANDSLPHGMSRRASIRSPHGQPRGHLGAVASAFPAGEPTGVDELPVLGESLSSVCDPRRVRLNLTQQGGALPNDPTSAAIGRRRRSHAAGRGVRSPL
eukprot:TRINITY_DN14582_c0_g1_i1.p1 TRINITY_DN14582_c0_g1~~TRINITY_DN14582_c0_g1_i1.p1  ORF type:complete len:605 (+),score=149.42 TRINITY_DN14582_c0_g1_i1:82-1815(+)